MRILAIADTHISEQHSMAGAGSTRLGGLRRSLLQNRNDLDWVQSLIGRHNPDLLVHAGDVYDRGNPTVGEQYVASEFFGEVGIPTLVVVGNHDRGYSSDLGLHALSPMHSRIWDDLTVVGEPRMLVRENVAIFCLPYPNRGGFSSSGDRHQKHAELSRGLDVILEDLANTAREHDGPTVLVSHVTFAGSSYESGQAVAHHDVQVPTSRLADFDFVIAGHLHKRQKIGGYDHAWYIGPIGRWSFNDQGNPAGAAIIDTDTGDFAFLENGSASVFQTYTVEDVVSARSSDGGVFDAVFARVVGEVQTETEYDEIAKIIETHRVNCSALRNDVTIAQSRDEISGVDPDDELDLFAHYLEQRPDAIPASEVEAVREHVTRILETI